MEEIEIIDKLCQAHGRGQASLNFTDYVELHKRMGRTIRYYLEQRDKGELELTEEEGGKENA